MTRHRISAGLYAPVRVLLREDSDGVAFEYDRPMTTFGQFADPDLILQLLNSSTSICKPLWQTAAR